MQPLSHAHVNLQRYPSHFTIIVEPQHIDGKTDNITGKALVEEEEEDDDDRTRTNSNMHGGCCILNLRTHNTLCSCS